jgi:SAM-dependent methyltransferase
MGIQKQVDKSIYEFSRYLTKQRWSSVWHQVDEVLRSKPKAVLEVGPGPGVFKQVCALFDVRVKTIDIDPELDPDYVGSATALPFEDSAFDVVCAFQMLEHLPYEAALRAFEEMVRVSKSEVVISLPDAKRVWRYCLHIPKLGHFNFLVPRPQLKRPVHVFDGEHYWEIGKKGYEFSRVVQDLSERSKLDRTYRVLEFTYHRFFVFKK